MNEPMESGGKDLMWVGNSTAIQWVKTQLKEVAETDLPVLILGAPGTGRRLAARTVHALSERREKPFITVECGGLHQLQADRFLFGGDVDFPQRGVFEKAQGGTVFLEEVDALPCGLQERLLKVLTEEQKRRNGSSQSGVTEVRLVAATHQDLPRLVRAGAFCAELYYRLGIAPVKLSVLKERRKDIPLLATYFATQAAARMGRPAADLSQEVIRVLLAHDWPGNVWELKRVLERAVMLADADPIRPEHLEKPFFLTREPAAEQTASGLLGFKPLR
ncbi:MAG: sigma-54-dependent Fis family transcriptional regulator [Gemmatimonadetes bacterium]|jgi:DNA-binding NtrC family response regulator|nr:sigma-54-dependent Fis family transcriptional regulator [Gemmatimonadota bacterium]